MYIVKFKKPLSELIEILKEQKIEVNILSQTESDAEIEVNVKDEREKQIFINVLALFITYSYYLEKLVKELTRRGIEKKKAEAIALRESQLLQETNYFSNITKIHIIEYFKNNSRINIDSFFVFNIKGLKEEIKIIAEEILIYPEELIDDEFDLINNSRFDNSMIMSEEDASEVFEIIANMAVENGYDLKDFEKIEVFNLNDNLVYKNSKGVVLDEDFFLNNLGTFLQFQNIDDTINDDVLKDVLLFNCMNNIFKIKEVIIHENIPEQTEEILLYNIKNYKGKNSNIKISYCKGCKDCK